MSKLLTLPTVNLDKIGSMLLILFGFTLPISVAASNIVAILILIVWLYRREYLKTWELIKNSKVLMSVLLFLGIHIIGMLWTNDLSWGMHIIKKEAKFLLLPIMMSLVQKEHLKYYVSSFILAMSISEFLSYLIWLHVIPPFLKATLYDPTPFMDHITYNPFLAIAIYVIGYYIFFDHTLSKVQKSVLFLFFITMSINMFITGGRAGQIGYFVVLLILFFQFFNTNIFKAMSVSVIVLSSIFFAAYHSSTIFQSRVDLAISEIKTFDEKSQGSVGIRMNWGINTLMLIKKHPIIGVGTGDYKNSYKEISLKRTPNLKVTEHPHNMYLLVMGELGLLGLLSLLSILYFQISFALSENNPLRAKIGITVPLLFMVIMLSDSYLLGQATTMLFIFFSAFLYRPFDEKNH